MGGISDFLISTRWIIKMQENMLREIGQEYHLTLIEMIILSFLHNNPERDTAADIVEVRMLQKSNVSHAVETLYQKKYLERMQDTEDRRKIHLHLTAQAQPVICRMEERHREFEHGIFSGILPEDWETYIRVSEKMKENIEEAAKRRG